MLFLEVLYSLLAHNDALGRLENLLLDDERCLPALHSVLLIFKVGSLRPHAIDMLEIVFKVLDYCVFVLSLLFNIF